MKDVSPLQVGVIGAGWWATFAHIPAILAHPRAELLAVQSRSQSKADKVAKDFGAKYAVTDPIALLDLPELDAVVIATTPNMHHAQAKAALPDAASKQLAWDSLVGKADLPNTIVRSAALGFVHPAGRDLLDAFVAPYFENLLPIWSSRTYKIAEYLIAGLYPAPLANAALRDATQAWLTANADAPAALRRLVNENLAGVERALRVQARDAE